MTKLISKAATFAKANRELRPKSLWLQYDEWLGGGKRNPNGLNFSVGSSGQLMVDGNPFTVKDALRLAAWIDRTFR